MPCLATPLTPLVLRRALGALALISVFLLPFDAGAKKPPKNEPEA